MECPSLVTNAAPSTNVTTASLRVAIDTPAAAISSKTTKTTRTVTTNALAIGTSGGKIKKKRGSKKSVLGSVVAGVDGTPMTGTQISKKLGVSLSKGYRVKRLAERFPVCRDTALPFELCRVRKKKDVLAVMSSINAHLSSFPHSIVVTEFEKNGIADVEESAWPDRALASKNRRQRAADMWTMYERGFYGSREPLNTLVCVMYEMSSVSSFMRSIRSYTHEFLSNILVVRMAGIFVIVMTDVRAQQRYPGDWLLSTGDHTSAFLWVNLKDACWLRYTTPNPVVSSVSGGSSKKRDKGPTGVFPKQLIWTKMSDVTVAGMHVLSFIWKRIETMMGATGVVPPSNAGVSSSSVFHIHVRPYIELPSGCNSKNVDGNMGVDMDEASGASNTGGVRCTTWCEEIVQFVEQFKYSKRVVVVVPTTMDTSSSLVVVPKATSKKKSDMKTSDTKTSKKDAEIGAPNQHLDIESSSGYSGIKQPEKDPDIGVSTKDCDTDGPETRIVLEAVPMVVDAVVAPHEALRPGNNDTSFTNLGIALESADLQEEPNNVGIALESAGFQEEPNNVGIAHDDPMTPGCDAISRLGGHFGMAGCVQRGSMLSQSESVDGCTITWESSDSHQGEDSRGYPPQFQVHAVPCPQVDMPTGGYVENFNVPSFNPAHLRVMY
jgi:hypothetical protein